MEDLQKKTVTLDMINPSSDLAHIEEVAKENNDSTSITKNTGMAEEPQQGHLYSRNGEYCKRLRKSGITFNAGGKEKE